MSQKRSREEYEGVSEIENPSPNANIKRVSVSDLSPMKKARSGKDYFDGILSDGRRNMRLYGFDSAARRKLEDRWRSSTGSVTLKNCEVTRSQMDGNQLQVYFTKRTEVENCEEGFDVEEFSNPENEESGALERKIEGVKVSAVVSLDTYDGCLNCSAEVVPIADEDEIGSCVSCETVQCLSDVKKELIANLIISVLNDGKMIHLRARGKTVEDIAQQRAAEITKPILAKAKDFTMCCRGDEILSVTRATDC